MTRFPHCRHLVLLFVLLCCLAGRSHAQVQISEFMALNQFTTFRDEDGERVDWIELHNQGAEAANLNGWYLTDRTGDLRRWQFPVASPVVSIPPGGRLVVFASDKNRKARADRLHTNFRLESSGGFLALVRPDGLTIEHSYNSYPQQIQDVSYGVPMAPWEPIVQQGAQARARNPISAAEMTPEWNASPVFDDSTWQVGQTGFGYDTTDSYGTLIGNGGNLQSAMYTVTPTALVRIVFDVANPASVAAVRLQVKYDDGYIGYLNGTKIAESNAPPSPTFDSSATADRSGGLVQAFEIVNLPTAQQLLVPGQNVLAFHLLNFTNGSTPDTDGEGTPNGSRALLLPVLEAIFQPLPTYLLSPTPNNANNSARTNVGPLISDTTSSPPRPLGNPASPAILITSKVQASLRPIGNVQLKYRVMYGAEVTISMTDDGTGGDLIADDGVYSAQMPTGTVGPGQMLRWKVQAVDTDGSSSTEPRFLNPLDNDQYFGTVALESQTTNSQLPTMHWFVQNPTASQQESGTRCSLYFLGRFYDNVFVGLHGQSSAGFPVAKKSHDFNFSKDNRFTWKEGEEPQRAINLITTWADKSHVRDTLAWESWQRAGHVASHWAQLVRVQQNGAFWGVYDMVENGDEDFLDRTLDQNGALYKIYNSLQDTSGAEKKSREFEGTADLQALINGLNPTSPLSSRRLYAYDNVDVSALVNYLANNVLIINNDFGHKNYYVYRDTEGTGEWLVLPWDQDLSLGHTWTSSQAYFNDDIDSQKGLVIGAASGNRLMNLIMNSSGSTVAPEMTRMFLRRLRTLMDTQLGPPGATNTPMEQRILELLNSMDPPGGAFATDADLDLQKWGYWLDGSGSQISPNNNFDAATHDHGPRKHAQRIIDSNPSPPYPASVSNAEGLGDTTPAFMVGRRNRLYNLNPTLLGLPIPPSQPAVPTGLTIEQVEANPASGNGEEEFFVIKNTNSQAIDISGWKIAGEIEHTFNGGTVIPPGGGTTENIGLLHMVRNSKAFRARATGPKGGQFRYVVRYDGRIAARGGMLELRNPNGTVVTSTAYPAAPTAAQEALRVTELNYAPPPPTPDELASLPGVQASDFEFIELTNIGSVPLDIGAAHFDRGITFAFPIGFTLAPGERTVVVASEAAFNLRYGTAANVAGQAEGNLSNSGEQLRLLDRVGEEVLRISYSPGWYPSATGSGPSLVSASSSPAFNGYDVAEGWTPSASAGGSPGTAEPPLLTSPAVGTITNGAITLDFTLPTIPLTCSLQVTFDNGVTPRVLSLAVSQENVGHHSITFDPANPTANPAIATGDALPDGTYAIVVSYQDTVDNPPARSSGGFGVTLDRVGPTITVPANVVVEAMNASGATASYADATATDPTDVAAITYSKESGSVFPLGVTLVTVTATDGATNIATADFTVSVQDTIPPQVTGVPAARVIETGPSGIAELPDLTGEVIASDLVGVTSITQDPVAGTILSVGTHTITFTVKDGAGNSGVATSAVEVQLNILPGTMVLASTGDVAPGAGTPGGPPAGSTLAAFGSPAISDLRHVAARVTLASGRKRLNGIYVEDAQRAAQIVAIQGSPAPGIAGAAYKTVLDPVISPNGAMAFLGKVNGGETTVKGDEGVWTTAFTGQLALAMREGQSLEGLPGPVVHKIASLSLRNGELLALISFRAGSGGVTSADDTALIRLTADGASVLLRENSPLTTAAGTANIKSIAVLSPAPDSPGHGRWHGDGIVVAKVMLTNKREVIVSVDGEGNVTSLIESGDAAGEGPGAPQWAGFGLPAMGGSGDGYAMVGSLALGIGGASDSTDTALVTSASPEPFTVIAREGSPAPGGEGATYSSFSHPVMNDRGSFLFAATLKGAGVSKANKKGLWWGALEDLQLLARKGRAPSGKDGALLPSQQWAAFVSYALPSGPDAGPIFLAKVKGTGVTSKSNLGLWAVDALGQLRELLRTGDQVTVGTASKVLSGITLLDAPRAVFGTTRSFNATGAVAVRATFTDKSEALLRIETP
jgi:hypothetical protein